MANRRAARLTQHRRVAPVAVTAPGAPSPADDLSVIERIPMAPDDRLLLTPTETARRLSISRALCYRLIGTGEIPSLVIGAKLRRVPVQALDAYIQSQLAAAGL